MRVLHPHTTFVNDLLSTTLFHKEFGFFCIFIIYLPTQLIYINTNVIIIITAKK